MDSPDDPASDPGPARAPGQQAGRRLALIDAVERDGRTGRVLDVQRWPLTLGRGLDNDLVLDDPFVAERHARIGPDADGRLLLTVLDTVNGVQVDGRHVGSGRSVHLATEEATGAGAHAAATALQIGKTRLRLRLAGTPVPAELPLPRPQRSRLWLALPLYALLVADLALGMDPGADTSAWLGGVLGLPALLMAWCAGWALLSKLFQHHFDFMGHLRIALPWALALTVVDLLLRPLAAAVGAAWLWQLAPPLKVLLGAFWLYAHLVHVLPLHRRALQSGVLAMTLVGAGLTLNATWRSRDSLFAAPYMSTLPLPAMRLGPTVPPSAVVDAMATLGPPLAARVRQSHTDDQDDGDDGQAD